MSPPRHSRAARLVTLAEPPEGVAFTSRKPKPARVISAAYGPGDGIREAIGKKNRNMLTLPRGGGKRTALRRDGTKAVAKPNGKLIPSDDLSVFEN